MLFADLKEWTAGHVSDGFATRQTEGIAGDAEDGLLSRMCLDGEGIARQRKYFLFEDERFGLASDELWKEGDRARERR